VTPVAPESLGVASFYDGIIYPRWHHSQAFGLHPLPVHRRIQHHFKHYKPPPLPSEHPREERILIAGAGSGHTVAQNLVRYSGQITALDLSRTTLAHAKRRITAELPDQVHRVRFSVGDITQLAPSRFAKALRDTEGQFDLVSAIGVLHHLPVGPLKGMERLADLLLPGGILEVAMYSTLGTMHWRPQVASFLHGFLPQLYNMRGDLTGKPSIEEIRLLRARVLALPAEDPVRQSMTRSEEFFSSTGCRDLLFHPCEKTVTLEEVASMLEACNLDSIGVFFPSMSQSLTERAKYAAWPGSAGDRDTMSDLRRWHRFESENPSAFGRMHVVLAQKKRT